MTGVFGFCIDWGPAGNVVPAPEQDLAETGARATVRNGHYFTNQVVTSIENDSFVSKWMAENVCPSVTDGKPVLLDRGILNRLCRFLRSLGTPEGNAVRDSLADWPSTSHPTPRSRIPDTDGTTAPNLFPDRERSARLKPGGNTMDPLEFFPAGMISLLLALFCTIYRCRHEDEYSPAAQEVSGTLIGILIAAAAYVTLILPLTRI